MRLFKWIEWNLSKKIDAHGLSAQEVEAAFDRVFSLQERRDGSFQMYAETPSGRRIWVIWLFKAIKEAPDDEHKTRLSLLSLNWRLLDSQPTPRPSLSRPTLQGWGADPSRWRASWRTAWCVRWIPISGWWNPLVS